MRSARWIALFSFAALYGCGGSTTDDTGTTQPGAGGAGGSVGGTGGTASAGASGKGGSAGSTAGAGGSTAGAGGSTAGAGGSTAGSGGSAAGAGGSSAGAGGTKGGAGGSTGGMGGSTGGAAGNGLGGAAGAPALDTSIDLVLPTVVQSKKPLGASSPTPGLVFRLDLRSASGGYEAVITPSFGNPAAMKVAVEPSKVTLTGSLVVHGNSGGNVDDTWTTVTIDRTASGGLADTVHAVGDEEAFGGDVIDMATLTGDGTLKLDDVAPLYQLRRSNVGGPNGIALPWDDFAIRASEPVDGIAKAVTVTEGGPPLAIVNDPSAVLWPGTIQASVLLSTWDIATGTLAIAVAGDVAKDPSGNFATAFKTTVPVQSVGPAQPQHSLDGDVITVSSWGKTAFLGGLVSDPACEVGGCAQFGPLDLGYCSQDEAGIAARLSVDQKTQVAVRFRVFSDQQSMVSSPVRVSVTGHDGKVTTSSIMVTLAANTGDFPFATPWSTALVPLPAGATGEVGVVVEAGTSTSCGFVPPAAKGRIVIDRIEAM